MLEGAPRPPARSFTVNHDALRVPGPSHLPLSMRPPVAEKNYSNMAALGLGLPGPSRPMKGQRARVFAGVKASSIMSKTKIPTSAPAPTLIPTLIPTPTAAAASDEVNSGDDTETETETEMKRERDRATQLRYSRVMGGKLPAWAHKSVDQSKLGRM